MLKSGDRRKRRGPVALSELIGKILDPVTARRGFASADLIASWPEIVGARYADCSQPEKIAWPRGVAQEGRPGVLVVRIEGPKSLYLQHETGQIVERVNAFIGHSAIDRIKIVQGPVGSVKGSARRVPSAIAPQDEEKLSATLADVDSDDLRRALDHLGRAILGEHDKKT